MIERPISERTNTGLRVITVFVLLLGVVIIFVVWWGLFALLFLFVQLVFVTTERSCCVGFLSTSCRSVVNLALSILFW